MNAQITTTANTQKLNDLTAFKTAKANLDKWVNELGEKTLSEAFGNKMDRGAPFSYQTLATLLHTSAGAIRDKWISHKAKSISGDATQEQINAFILRLMKPLTPEEIAEQARKEAEKKANIAAANKFIEMFAMFTGAPLTLATAKDNAFLAKQPTEVVTEVYAILKANSEVKA